MAKKFVGTVASDVQDKTIVVTVTRRVTHPIYGKQYTVSKKFQAHDEDNKAKKGDKVEIVETRPISKNKTFKLSKVVVAGHSEIQLKEDAPEALAPAQDTTPEPTKEKKKAEKK